MTGTMSTITARYAPQASLSGGVVSVPVRDLVMIALGGDSVSNSGPPASVFFGTMFKWPRFRRNCPECRPHTISELPPERSLGPE